MREAARPDYGAPFCFNSKVEVRILPIACSGLLSTDGFRVAIVPLRWANSSFGMRTYGTAEGTPSRLTFMWKILRFV
jgi:hypothetical protein